MHSLYALWRSWRRDEQGTIIVCLLFISFASGACYAQRQTAPLPPLFQEAPIALVGVNPVANITDQGSSNSKHAGEKTILVHIAGEVQKAGVFSMPASSRIVDVIKRAGGATGEGDIQALNLAAVLKDGQQVTIPRRSAIGTTAAGAAGGSTAQEQGAPWRAIPSPVNVNTASAAQLEALPGIGPAIAAQIVEYREQQGRFQSIEELDNVKGIGAAKLEKLRGLVTF